jgi:hypothetical protein
LDIAKYRNLFLEEATEHLAEMSRSLLALEKEPELRESIEAVFRAAHSIKSMAASLSYWPTAWKTAWRAFAAPGASGTRRISHCSSAACRRSSRWWRSCERPAKRPAGATTSFSPPSRGRLQRAGNQKKKFAIRLL